MSLNEKAMLVFLNISFWTARKYDRQVSREIDDKYNSRKAGRFNKILIAKKHLANISQIKSQARSFHYDNTLPWNDNGGRLLPAANYFDYIQVIRNFKDDYEKEVNNFINIYPDLKEEQRLRLGTMFKEDDYPDVATLKMKYNFSNHISPLAQADDFRVELNSDEVDTIKESIKQQMHESTKTAMNDLWKRLFKVVSCMVERLSDPDNKFKNSLVGNIRELCEILPKLNITGDIALKKAVKEIRSKLTINDSQTLRENKSIRNRTAQAAQEILNKMRPYQTAA